MANELKIRVVFDTGGSKPMGDLPPKIKEVEGSLKDLELQWKKLDAIARSGFAVGSPEQITATANATAAYKKYSDALVLTGTSATKVRPQLDGMAHGSANAAMTLQALNYTVRDSPYFFRDFSLGILAIGNNLNPLIDGFIRMKQEAGGTGGALKTLAGMMTGPQGAIFGFSMLVTIIQAVTFAMAKNKSVAKEMGEGLDALLGDVDKTRENLRKYREELEKIGLLETPEKTDEIREAISKLIKEMNENVEKAEIYRQTWYNTMMLPVAGWIANVGMAIGRMFFDWDNKDNQKKLDLLTEGLHKLSQTSADVAGIFQSSVNGTLGDALKSLKFDDLTKLNTELGKLKGQLTADNKPGSINFGASWGWGTAEQIDKLQKKIHDILNPQKDKKDKTGKEFDDFAYLKPYLDELKKLEAQKPFAQTREEAEKLQEAIQKVNDEIDSFNNRISNEQKTSEAALKFKAELENNFQKELKKGIKDGADFQIEWDEKIAQHAAKTIHDELISKIESIKATYKKLYDDLDKDKRGTPEEKTVKKRELDKAQLGEINEAKIDSAYKAIEERMGNIKSMALSIGEDLFNAAINGKEGIDSMIKSIPILLAKLALRVGIETIINGLMADQKAEAAKLIIAQGTLATESGIAAGEMAITATSMTISAGAMTTAATAMTTAAIAMAAAKAIAGIPFFPFANGGIVGAQNGYIIPGTSYTGDKVPILANSGEMVLNLSQQQNLLKLLSAPVNPYNQMMMGRMDAMNMNMVSGQPTILIQSNVPGLEFTKKIINPAQAKLIRGNVISVS